METQENDDEPTSLDILKLSIETLNRVEADLRGIRQMIRDNLHRKVHAMVLEEIDKIQNDISLNRIPDWVIEELEEEENK